MDAEANQHGTETPDALPSHSVKEDQPLLDQASAKLSRSLPSPLYRWSASQVLIASIYSTWSSQGRDGRPGQNGDNGFCGRQRD
jgi:hypothetical protein